jgi:hypothetical protein
MEGMEAGRKELTMLAPHLRLHQQFIRDGIRGRGLSDGAALRLSTIFVHFHDILCARPHLQNKFLLRCARILRSMQSARLTSQSFASQDFGSDSCQQAYNALLGLLIVKQEMEQGEIDLYRVGVVCPLEGDFTALHMTLEETAGAMRNAVVCRIACLVSDLPAAMVRWLEQDNLRVATNNTRTELETAAIAAVLQTQQLQKDTRADLRHKIQCRLYGVVKDEDTGESPPPAA